MLTLTHLHKKINQKIILENFNLTIKQGEMVALVGPSGSGKSTVLNVLGLIDNFDSGDYTFLGHKNVNVNTRKSQRLIRDNISYLFQNFALIDSETVLQNLLLALKYSPLTKKEKRKTIAHALENVDLAQSESRKIFELSGGEQQRVAIARALIKPSKLLLADEPTGSLDVLNRDAILTLLREINAQGKTVVIVTHDLEVAKICSKIITLA
ncbi:ABC transporter ATP-binding protein [Vagococcus salmoninarum]|uniref:ABC transporter ATP-binding protein n=1 Tax=Vagococcus salmoninarum TaxID=2739 RepID=UPI00187EC691|nr:ABC transporter ATP-binding protein [Vagococcus salmoninarum]MBE9388652.1 ABC transporter ATP-binding protein [Vagococcus salmoninarum]